MDTLLASTPVSLKNGKSISQFFTSIQKHIAVLEGLGHSTRQWTPLLLHIVEKNLDQELRSRWELTVGHTSLSFNDKLCVIEKLENRASMASICTQYAIAK